MQIESCKKSTIEKYDLKLDSWNYVTIMIDDRGDFTCTGDYGNFSYSWRAFGDDFKKFLKRLDGYYLYEKFFTKDYFDFYEWQKKALRDVIEMRRRYELDKDEARIVYDIIKNDIEEYDSCDVVATQIWNDSELGKIFDDIVYCDFFPSKSYSPRQRIFIEEIYPEFVKLL